MKLVETHVEHATPLLERTLVKVTRRLLPFLLLMYVVSFLDRANVGFAKRAFQLDTGLSDAVYAFGAGIFFIGYAILEVPSNLIMHRVGARIWMCRIMVTWGLISAAMMFASTESKFYSLRFLLGVAEAGFFPGIIYYLSCWYPAHHRSRALGFFYFGAPIAFILGGPLSGLLLELDGVAGLRGWQWMFVVEGLLASVVGVWAYWYLTDKPADAKWLTAEEKRALKAPLELEAQYKSHHGPADVWHALRNGAVLYLCLIYFLIQIAVYGVIFYLPTQVAGLLGKKVGLEVGLVTAIPWICAIVAAYVIPKFSDHVGERHFTAAATLFVAGLGIAGSAAAAGTPALALVALCFAASGFIAVQPIFWTFPTGYLTGAAAAGGIALVNSVGALGGFVAPNLRAWSEAAFASTTAGLYALAMAAIAGALLIIGLKRVGLREAGVEVAQPETVIA
jgi:sugar phosphate permease